MAVDTATVDLRRKRLAATLRLVDWFLEKLIQAETELREGCAHDAADWFALEVLRFEFLQADVEADLADVQPPRTLFARLRRAYEQRRRGHRVLH